ncbi:AraC family transcriptional regulator, partial [Mycobacterium sp. ITM-2017-0098]
MGAWKNATAGEPLRGVVGRPASSSAFDLRRWPASGDTAHFVEHFWAVSWDLRGQDPFDSAVITFPAMHITHEWGEGNARHGFSLPNT